ncbi:MAG: MBL fold metallo-hydrolase [Hespellia sp.]|nr:MBL fold metallo-hydrolase [Hespellia sp.]
MMAVEQVHQEPDIFVIKVPLPNNPLRDLNVYVVVSGGEALVIDTGFRMEECKEALMAGLRALRIPMERMTLFLTHMHSDHAGQSDLFSKAGCPVYMNRIDIEWLEGSITGKTRAGLDAQYLENGFPEELLKQVRFHNPMYAYAPIEALEIMPMDHGDVLKIGDLTLECIFTGGHTPGHSCLWIQGTDILFSGDHILYDITPNICAWTGVEDSLGDYISSLKKVDRMPFSIAYPAHRMLRNHPHERIEALLQHHVRRLNEILEIIDKYSDSGIVAYDVASKMKWSIRCSGWDVFPVTQKWFAVGETIAHLVWLFRRGYVDCQVRDGQKWMYPGQNGKSFVTEEDL